MRQPLIAGNWKMNGSLDSIKSLLEELRVELENSTTSNKAEILVLPPCLYVDLVIKIVKDTPIKVGVQNVSGKLSGAYTGEISAFMAKDLGCAYGLVGHSERRILFKETDDLVVEKFIKIQESGMTPILCVGESLKERSDDKTLDVIEKQITSVINSFTNVGDDLKPFVIAYEPVWAIGGGVSASKDQVTAVHAAIRNILKKKDKKLAETTRVLYGGSLTPASAPELLKQVDIDGGLVGGASLRAKDFATIYQVAVNKK